MQSVIPQLFRHDPTVLAKEKGLKVLLPSHPHSVLLLMRTELVAHPQVLLLARRKVLAQILQVSLALHSIQLATLQMKHWLRTVFRVNPVRHYRQVPVMLLQREGLQLEGHEGVH